MGFQYETAKQQHIFNCYGDNDWEVEWLDMPEYNNVKLPPPEMLATFKFKTHADYLDFTAKVKEHVYGGEIVFTGKQLLDKKTTWYPLIRTAPNFRYTDES